MKLILGQFVTWASQAGGHRKEKAGNIVEVVPPNSKPKTRPLDIGCLGRDHESYVVRVGRKNYWPRVSALDYYVTVCSHCLRASCWHGEFSCEAFRGASTVSKLASELRRLHLENPAHFSPEKLASVEGRKS